MKELNESQLIIIRDRLKELLSKGEHKIVFTKSDGSTRVMRSTRDASLMEESLVEQLRASPGLKKDGTPKKEPVSAVRCVDLDINEWRSFSIEKLISIDETPFPEYLNSIAELGEHE